MGTLATILVIYGILCIIIALLKPQFIWNMKKFQIMEKMFKGSRNLQLFILVWGLTALIIGLLI
jgi:formate-dependent nitrite reductase membrane component NrfD